LEDFSGYIYSFRIEDNTQEKYSANLIIGEKAGQELPKGGKCTQTTYDSDTCLEAVRNYINNAHLTEKPFILDYTESEVSLVMQSGAL
jgi:hypothetical protein